MNLANVFGIHLGCLVYCKDDVGCETTGRLVAVRNGVEEYSVRVKYTEFNEGRWYKLKDCKLILKPLSAITEEDKREFEKVFEKKNKIVRFGEKFGTFFYLIDTSKIPDEIIKNLEISRDVYSVDLTAKQTFWLASKGFDVGLVPEENKIVEG